MRSNGQLEVMRRQALEVQSLRQRPPVPPAGSGGPSGCDRTFRQAGRLDDSGDRATLTAIAVPGEALAGWLDEIRAAARAKPVEVTLTQTEPGRYSGYRDLGLGGRDLKVNKTEQDRTQWQCLPSFTSPRLAKGAGAVTTRWLESTLEVARWENMRGWPASGGGKWGLRWVRWWA